MNKADPFGEMSSRENSAMGDEPVVAEPSSREEEPVEADHVGALLCATRMRAGGDLQEIAKVLRIRYGYLVAIEDGRHEDLPGSAYSIGFIRAYADYLGLDGNEVVRRLREETNGTVTTARFQFPTPSGESGLPNGGLLAIAVVMGMVVYGSWYTITNSGRDAVDLIQEVPSRLAVLIDGQDQATVAEPTEAQSNVPSQTRVDDIATASGESEGARDPAADLDAAEISDTEQGTIATNDTAAVSTESASSETPTSEVVSAEGQPEESAEFQATDNFAEAQTGQSTESTEPSMLASEAEVSESVDTPTTSTETPSAVEETSQLASTEPTQTQAVQTKSESAPNQAEPAEPVETLSRVASSASESDEETAAATSSAEISAKPPVVQPDRFPPEAESQRPDSVDVMKTDSQTVTSDDAESDTVEQAVPPEMADDSDTVEVAEVKSAVAAEPAIIELRAKSDSWIQVRDGDELLLTRLLRQGEVYRVPDREGLTLMTGNAGGLEVFVGGKQAPPLGDKGVVRRGVPLNAERLRTGIAPG